MRTRLVLITTLAATALMSSSASAFTTIGSPSAATFDCDAGRMFTSLGSTHTAPEPGVVTLLGFNFPTAGALSVKVTRTIGVNLSEVRSSTAPISVPAGPVQIAARLPIATGDQLSAYMFTTTDCRAAATGNTKEGNIAEPFGSYSTAAHTTLLNTGLSITARIERDVDGDGFGDESQDACVAVAGRQVAPCVCKVPKLKAMTKAKATAELVTAGCKLGKTKKKKLRKFTKKQKKNRIRSQSVAAGADRPFGTVVDITINTKKKSKKK